MLTAFKQPHMGNAVAIRLRLLEVVKDEKKFQKMLVQDVDVLLFYMKQACKSVTKGGSKPQKRSQLMKCARNTAEWQALDA